MATILPLTNVASPPVPKARFGLFSAVNVVDSNDLHIIGGVDYMSSLMCSGGNVINMTDCKTPILGQVGGGPAFTTAIPGIVNAQYQCKGPMDLVAFQAGAVQAISANAERFLSAALITPTFFDPATAITLSPGSTSASEALGVLEGQARTSYSGQAVIHGGASVISRLTAGNQIVRVGDHLETVSGNLVHPMATTADNALYMTGYITIWRGPNKVMGPVQEKPTGQYDNTFRTVAMQPVAIANDCGIFYKVTGVTA